MALHQLGVAVAIEKSQPNYSSLYRSTVGAACFSSTGRYEIKYLGKKLIGSAQRRYNSPDGEDVVLQHGSILLGPEHKRIVDFLNVPSEADRTMLRTELDQKTIDLSTILKRIVNPGEVADSLLRGFQKAWSIMPEVVNMVHESNKVTT